MARKFSHPEVKALEVGQQVIVRDVDADTLTRRVSGYEKRAGRAYGISYSAEGPTVHIVYRCPDPQP